MSVSAGSPAQTSFDVVAGGQLGVADHVPGRGPAQRAGQRRVEAGDVLHDGGHRPLVEAQLGVGEVVVVEQQHVGGADPGQRGDLGARAPATSSSRRSRRTRAPSRSYRPTPMRWVRRVGYPSGASCSTVTDRRCRPGAISTIGRSVLTCAVSSHCGGELPQLPARGLLQRGEQVVEGRVAPGVLVEVGAQPGDEGVDPDVGHQLLDDAGALGVGDAVEVHLDRVHVGHLAVDRVGGGELVLAVAPVLADRQERRPGVGEPGGARCCTSGRPTRRTTRSATGRPTTAWSPGRRTTCAPARAGSCWPAARTRSR